ncbi:hypothetical protein GGE65_007115 [Skermanella aerolata]|uniref:tetratricopeptide repeat protein n=1 Tax=Skermanella aerolata TaxID=393310 RepID=UPI003D1B5D33
MPVRPSQPSNYPGGRARIDVTGAGNRLADPVQICIVDQMAGADKSKHLDPRTPEMPWKPAVFWFAPTNVQRDGAQLSFDLEHGITFHLRPNAPYILRLAGADGGMVEERLVWKPIRGKSSAPEWTAPAVTSWPPEPPPIEPPQDEPAPVEPRPAESVAPPAIDTVAAPEEDKESRSRRIPLRGLAVAAAIVLALGAGAAWWYLPGEPNVTQEAAPIQPPAGPATVQEARRMVQEKIPADVAVREAQRFLNAKSPDGAFLLFRHAAEQGNASAAVAVGGMYDPATHSPETSPMPSPNADQAAAWYAKAADTGDAEGEFRLGRVLMSGRTEDPQGPEKAIMWLQKAADQGHDGARAALPK